LAFVLASRLSAAFTGSGELARLIVLGAPPDEAVLHHFEVDERLAQIGAAFRIAQASVFGVKN
jgi:hypothetical protein